MSSGRWTDGEFRVVFIQLSAGWRYWAFGPDGWDCKYGLDPSGYTSMPAAIEAVQVARAKLPLPEPPERGENLDLFHTTIRG